MTELAVLAGDGVTDGAPDAIDGLLGKGLDPDGQQRLLDFVRRKFRVLTNEKKELMDRVQDLEHSLDIIQTAQAWSLGNQMSHQQAQKVKEVTSLLLQAKKARADALAFSKVGKPALFEKLRVYKNQLNREKAEKKEMRERLIQAFEQAKVIKEKHQKLEEKRRKEREIWQQMIRQMRDKHYREFDKLKIELGEHDVQKQERLQQLGNFGEKVMAELQNLQEHLSYVKAETIENVEAAAKSPVAGEFFITQGM
eukprot:CAMPEP_0178998576 /NCGR_PEP_ID=MMETSP0795-20121207/9585_1 /TAXON_ID=88552 /ORGANISM="Amoebophrya sp., Strain Ameob2" /LENGTH=252 /DNA_ID=CAMNT_0020691261 /DNA_START=316 /DNA_END=1074 /DNA_ORIENTATION=-